MENNVQKAEGVGGWEKGSSLENTQKIMDYLDSLAKDGVVNTEVGRLKHFLFKLIGERDDISIRCQIAATRAAEERKDQEMLDFCLSICANDKTPRYGYDGKKERNANAYGQFPDEGRWCTPNEMAADKANKIKQKRKSLPPPPSNK